MFELGTTFFSAIAEFFSLTFPGTQFTFFQIFVIFMILKVCLEAVYIILGVSLDSTVDKSVKKITK